MTAEQDAKVARSETARRFALRGLIGAVQAIETDTATPQIAAGQGAFWAAAIDEQLKPLPWYGSQRDKDGDGRVLPGLRLARNGVTHGAVVVARTAGLAFPLFADGALDFGPWIWKPLDELLDGWPPQGRAAEVEREKASYDLTISQRPLAEPLERAARWFQRLEDAHWKP